MSAWDAHDSVQGPTSQPSGMISKLQEPRKQCHGCDLCVCVACIAVARGMHHLFEGEFVEEDSCTLSLSAQLPELQLQLWLANLFLVETRFYLVNINT